MSGASSSRTVGRQRVRFVVLLGLFGVAAFWGALRFAGPPTAAPTHPITGRHIAGIATDAHWMDRATREEEEAPELALASLGVTPGMTVADVGAGTGYMSVRLARRVGPTGKVYATDLQPGLLKLVQEKTQAEHLVNVVVVQGTETDARLPDSAIDLALLVDVYHEFSHPREMLRSIRSSLKSGGRLVLVEYRSEDPTLPIAPTYRMSVAGARREIEAEGFAFVEAAEDLPRQHVIMFRKD